MNRKNLSKNYDFPVDTDSCSSDCSDYEENGHASNSSEVQHGANRMPTRRPDPNVFNRNALMARENRRRKKAYVETLEKEVENSKKENKQLLRTIKKQSKLIKKIQGERTYYRNILVNKTEIQQLVSAIRSTPNLCGGSTKESSCSPGCSPATNYSSGGDILEGGSENDYKSYDNNNWDLLGINSPLHTAGDILSDSENFSSNITHVNDEHNYYASSVSYSDEGNTIDSGICLHIAGGKISLEFCPSCHQNSKLGDDLLAGV